MAALNTLNNSCELNITPSRKRKRNFDKFEQETQSVLKTTAAGTSCFTNAAFSSTPKGLSARKRTQLKKNKENENIFSNANAKSITEILKQNGKAKEILQNPYEVLRKPPKKKKRHTEGKACFENPALNLELPEKQFNPFEVVREKTPNKKSNCFSNPALNLKFQDAPILCNPFEVRREAADRNFEKLQKESQDHTALLNPFEISPLEDIHPVSLTPKPCKVRLGLPIVPKVGYRINFSDMSMSQLTPSKLLAEKLVFSPVPRIRVPLDSIGEESTTDIGKELDRYQLELENSINEARLRKNDAFKEDIYFSPPTTYQIQVVDIEKKSKFTQKLCGILEDSENEQIIKEATKQSEIHIKNKEHVEKAKQYMAENNPILYDLNKQYQSTETAQVIEVENLDGLYGCSVDDQEDEDSFDYKTPTPFVRAYTKPDRLATNLTVSKETLSSNTCDKSTELGDHIKKSLNVKSIIRKSIRKLTPIHNHGQQRQTDTTEKPENEKHSGIINAMRRSLRRKPVKKPLIRESEVSIIDSTERTIKLKSNLLQTEYVKIEDLTNEKKHNIRSSIRKSTIEVRNQFLKSIFNKKHEEYDFNN